MKKLLLSLLFLTSFTTLSADISITSNAVNVQAVEITTSVNCVEAPRKNYHSIRYAECKLADLRSNLSEKFKNVLSVKGLNKVSNQVLNKSILTPGEYEVELQVLYY